MYGCQAHHSCHSWFMQTFVNVATGGFGAEVTEATDTGMKNTLGGAAYILTGLMKPHTISAKSPPPPPPPGNQVVLALSCLFI